MSEELDMQPVTLLEFPEGTPPFSLDMRRTFWEKKGTIWQGPDGVRTEDISLNGEVVRSRSWPRTPLLPDTLLVPPSVTVAATVEVFPPFPRPRLTIGECRMGSYLPGPDEAAHQFYHDWHGTRCAWDAPDTPWYARLWRAVRGWVES